MAKEFDGSISPEVRKKKLEFILTAIEGLNDFSTDYVKDLCRDIAPAYVTKTLNRLVDEGRLERIAPIDKKDARLAWSRRFIDQEVDQWVASQIYGDQVKHTPKQDRPRERLLSDGAASLTDAELLAILIRVGSVGESAIHAGRKISSRYSERIEKIVDAGIQELKAITPAIRVDSYSQIMAGIELGRRIAMKRDVNAVAPVRIRGSDDAMEYCQRIFARLASDGLQEQFHIVTLDTQYGPINNHLITIGTLDASLVHPREVFRPAIRDSASAILLIHNHPSGDPTPSREDHAVTRKLEEVGNLIGIKVLDHIVVAKESCVSIMALRT